MSVATLRLVFAVVWAAIAVLLLTRHSTAPAGLADRLQSRNLDLGGLLAAAFALWNLARWWQARPRRVTSRSRKPPRREYHPEFDFNSPRTPLDPES